MPCRHCLWSVSPQCGTCAARGESPEELLQALQLALARRAWVQPALPVASSSSSPQHGGGRTPPEGTTGSQLRAQDVGVAGILRRQEAAQQSRGRNMEEAFTDLTALMDKAKDMLAFAERIRDAMLRDSQSADAASAEELEVRCGLSARSCVLGFHAASSSALLQSCMLSLGILSPVTRKAAGALYHQQLALQVSPGLIERCNTMSAGS
jgi:ESCRT-II complex subunit VPS36